MGDGTDVAPGDAAGARRVTGACSAPSAALYLRPDGQVAACCGSWHLLGSVTGPDRRSLREIWHGARAAQLRDAVAAHDFGLGCWECGQLVRAGRRSASLAASFDRWGADAEYPAMIDFAMSNRCNLQCVMCNGGLSSAIRRHREHREPLPAAYDERFFDELREFLPHLRRAQFKGGEPFLAPENRRVWDDLLAIGARPEVCVTTNGTVWSKDVRRYVEDLAMDVIVSVDATEPDVLRSIRVGVDPDRLWRNVDRLAEITRRTGATLDLHMCLMSTNWAQLAPFLLEADRRELGADLIWVDGPAQFNLLTMPLADLAAAHEQLRAAEPGLDGLRDDLRSIWDGAIERIGDAVSRRQGTAVAAPVPATEDDPAEVRRRALTAAGRTPVVELELVDDVIRTATVPEWARWLDPQSWVGRGLEETVTVISQSAGSSVRTEVESLPGGVHRARFTFDPGAEEVLLDGWYLPGREAGRSHLILVHVEDPAAPV